MLEEDRRWHQLSLRLSGDSLPVDEIQSLLALPVAVIARKGEPAGGKPGRAIHRTNLWVHRHTIDTRVPFADQMCDLLGALERKREALLKLMSSPGNEAELFLGFSSVSGQGGAFFPPELIARVAALGLAIVLDLYPPGEPEEEVSVQNPGLSRA